MNGKARLPKAHAQALNEAHDLYGGHEHPDRRWMEARAAWVTAREAALTAPRDTDR